MDLVQTVRKEGSRGGTGDFKWSDVQTSSHREHYLGHSIMAPTGRWAKGKDLTWYAKGNQCDGDDAAVSEADARKAEIKRIKEAEQDAMARALGLPVPDRSNPNNQELGQRKEVERVLKGAASGENAEGKGIGYARELQGPPRRGDSDDTERIEGNAEQQDRELRYALNEYKRRRTDDQPKGVEHQNTDDARAQATGTASVEEEAAHGETLLVAIGMSTDDATEAVHPVRKIVTDAAEIHTIADRIAETHVWDEGIWLAGNYDETCFKPPSNNCRSSM